MQKIIWAGLFLVSFNGVAMAPDLLAKYNEYRNSENRRYWFERSLAQKKLEDALREQELEKQRIVAAMVEAKKERAFLERKLKEAEEKKKQEDLARKEKERFFGECLRLVANFRRLDVGREGKKVTREQWALVGQMRKSFAPCLSCDELNLLQRQLGRTSPNGALLNAVLIDAIQKNEREEGVVFQRRRSRKTPSPLSDGRSSAEIFPGR